MPGIEPRLPGRPARSQTLYCLSYPVHLEEMQFLLKRNTEYGLAHGLILEVTIKIWSGQIKQKLESLIQTFELSDTRKK
jgi:hypothetical protein